MIGSPSRQKLRAKGLMEGRSAQWLYSMVVILTGISLPAIYFAVGLSGLSASVRIAAQVRAEIVSQHISRSPGMWQFEEHRLLELLTRFPPESAEEKSIIRTLKGEVIVASPHAPDRPVIEQTEVLHDAGKAVAQVVVIRSIRHLAMSAFLVALLCMGLAAVTLYIVSRLRLRNQAMQHVIREQESRARITLEAIGDAVIAVNAKGQIDFMNPAAERLIGIPQSEAKGDTIDKLVSIVDERTSQSLTLTLRDLHVEGPAHRAGNELALLRSDGSRLSIEHSSAPILGTEGQHNGAVMILRDVTSFRRMAQRMSWAAAHDALTGLVNRREFESRVELALKQSHQSDLTHVLAFVDLDQFKIVNDTCGHAAGDAMLRQLGDCLKRHVRENDTLARLGGDEFGILFLGCSIEHAVQACERMLQALREQRFLWQGRFFSTGASVGLVSIDADTGSAADLFIAADTACYQSKEDGRGRISVFKSSDESMMQRRGQALWVVRLKEALEQGHFRLYHQPYRALSAQGDEHLHLEVLIRLRIDDGSVIPPGAFLPAAERFNLMPQIDRWVITQVMAGYQTLCAHFGQKITCAINLSGNTLNSEGILDFVAEQIRTHAIAPGSICFEITESAAIHNLQQATHFMREVKAMGCLFALDDFGMGTSSLGYLKTLPVDVLKIDGSFVRNLPHDMIDRTMVETINRVGHLMGLQTVAEFAESEEIIEHLRQIGVDFAQGYAVARPSELPLVIEPERARQMVQLQGGAASVTTP